MSFHSYSLAYQVQYLPNRVSTQVYYGCIQNKHQYNVQPIQVGVSPSQIRRDDGGFYMYPACKYFAVIIQEFDESIATAGSTLGKLGC